MSCRFEAFLAERLACLPFTVAAEVLLSRDVPLQSPGKRSANGSCRLFAARDGWVALNLARAQDIELVPALTERQGDPWECIADAAEQQAARQFVDAAVELHLPAAALGESRPLWLADCRCRPAPRRVLDLSVLWAGPQCAGLLAKAGAQVRRIENLARPDPTPVTSPGLDRWLNGDKERIDVDLSSVDGQERLAELIAWAEVVVTSARAGALARLGLDDALLARRPDLLWVTITAHGWDVDRVGFGDDCAVAGGLVRWESGQPEFMGDALADPLTGLEAALAALRAVQDGRGGRLDMTMARVAAAYAAGSA